MECPKTEGFGMRILVFSVVFVLVFLLVVSVFIRLAPMHPDQWHVDPSSATPPNSPNYALLIGENAPVVSGSVQDLSARVAQIAQDNGWQVIGGDAQAGFVTYVTRSRVFGFPDAISIKLSAAQSEGDAERSRIEIFSRSRFGYDDLGANEEHVAKLLRPLTS